jgi:uncharacterized protein (DUF488 family)
MKIYTIGFTKKTAGQFFQLLKENGIECVVDIRLHPDGQLSGFSKKGDLAYFLKELLACDYRHLPVLAPSEEVLNAYRKDHDWPRYEEAFEALMTERGIPQALDQALFQDKVCCLLCSEDKPDHCHRRLVAERLAQRWKDVEIIHL